MFAALNTAFLHDGALIIVPRETFAAAPVHLLFVATQKEVASYPRCLLVAEAGSTVTVVEDFVALQDEAYFTNAVTEIAVGDGARVATSGCSATAARRFTLPTARWRSRDASRYQSVSVTLGARISRYNLNVLQRPKAPSARSTGWR